MLEKIIVKNGLPNTGYLIGQIKVTRLDPFTVKGFGVYTGDACTQTIE